MLLETIAKAFSIFSPRSLSEGGFHASSVEARLLLHHRRGRRHRHHPVPIRDH
jgi:hypothetical protein